MPKILSWDSSYSVGDAILDKQHKKLMGLCNQLANCTDDENGSADSPFHKILDELSAYACEHFKTEEAILQACAYPRLATQAWDHAEYQKHVAEALVSAGRGALSKTDLQGLLSNWWNDHILISDMDYRGHVMAFNKIGKTSGKQVRLAYSTGEQVLALREKKQLSLRQFWYRLGIAHSSGSRYESGRSIPVAVQYLLQLAYGTPKQANALLEQLRDGVEKPTDEAD